MEPSYCSSCGTPMNTFPNPDKGMIENSSGLEHLRSAVESLGYKFKVEDVGMEFCLTCPETSLVGPEVMIVGTVS